MSKKIKTLSDFYNIKANKSKEGTRVVKFCISPKLMSFDFSKLCADYQTEYNNFLSACLRNYDSFEEHLREYIIEESMFDTFCKVIRRIDEYKKSKPEVYKQTQWHANVFRNDFMFDDKKQGFYQIEVNHIAASMHSFSQNLESLTQMLFCELDTSKAFPSKIVLELILTRVYC